MEIEDEEGKGVHARVRACVCVYMHVCVRTHTFSASESLAEAISSLYFSIYSKCQPFQAVTSILPGNCIALISAAFEKACS